MQPDLFASRRPGRIDIITPEEGGFVTLFQGALSQPRADRFLDVLTTGMAWEQRSVTVFGKRHPQPRLVAWHGDPGTRYSYAGDTLVAQPWTDELLELKRLCEGLSGSTFNSVLLNLYRDGNDAMGWHADNEPELGSDPLIASLSLGCERRFDLRHRNTGDTRRVVLPHGSLLVMAGTTQSNWVHQVPRSKKILTPRVNLTFRTILAPATAGTE